MILCFFCGKRTIVFITPGSILLPIQRGMLQFAGFDVLVPNIVYARPVKRRGTTLITQCVCTVLGAYSRRVLLMSGPNEICDSKKKSKSLQKLTTTRSKARGIGRHRMTRLRSARKSGFAPGGHSFPGLKARGFLTDFINSFSIKCFHH